MILRFSVTACLLLVAMACHAGDCTRTGSTCIDAIPCKTISGVQVCLSQFGLSCWTYQDTYTCLKPGAVNYCQPFIDAQPACWQTDSRCALMDTLFNTGCMQYNQTWRCGDPNRPTPANTLRLDNTYTLVSSDYDPAPCQALSGNPNCQLAGSQCLLTTSPTLPPGIVPAQVAPDGCFQRQNTYACLSGQTNASECAGYAANPDCSLQSMTCDPADRINGQCTFEQQTYRCVSQPASSHTTSNCAGQLFCMDGKCFDRGYPNDPDFARSMALMEAAREAGVYGSDVAVFSGNDSRCRIKLLGLTNCCKQSSGGAGFSNTALLSSAVKIGGEALDAGSGYVYDALYDTPTLQQGLGAALNTLSGGTADGMFNPSFSFYGLSFEFLPSQGLVFTGFDPTSFAIEVGLMILQDLMACDPPEQILALRRGQHLCHEIGTYCSQELSLLLTKVCIEHTKSYCCYNSRLARILNEQGRAQIGKSWGSAKSPNCSGFTQAEFAAIDFSKIDLSEFTAEILANVKIPNVGALGQQIQSSVQQKVQNYYQR